MGQSKYSAGPLTNIACDAVINASIARFFPVHSDVGRLFTRCYADRGIEAILRPGCQNVREGRFEGVYTNLYGSHVPQTDRLTTGELIQTLKGEAGRDAEGDREGRQQVQGVAGGRASFLRSR